MEEGKKAKKWAARVWTREALLLTSLAALGIMFGVTQTAVSFYRGKQTDLANIWFQRGDAALNAELLRRVLDGGHGPYRDVVLANASAALVAAGKAQTFRDGVECAAEAIDCGGARRAPPPPGLVTKQSCRRGRGYQTKT